MGVQLAILTIFVVLQTGAKVVLPKLSSRLCKYSVVRYLKHMHVVVWICHPAVLHGIHDYAVHFTVWTLSH